MLLASVFVSGSAVAQQEITREEYIATYAPLAVEQQQRYGIPASIKLAQGILESQYGNSELARRSNNHFGIKCKSYWTGDTVRYDDDAKGECFRKYRSVAESYADHSKFLVESPRYAKLFTLKPTDYRGWAHGLKAAGYATNPHYAQQLIRIIDDYELYLFDEGEVPSYVAAGNYVPGKVESGPQVAETVAVEKVDIDNYEVSVYSIGGRGIFRNNGVLCLVARADDTYSSLARLLGIPEKRLRRYNDASSSAFPTEGEFIYAEPKRNAFSGGADMHRTVGHQTLRSLSQEYGIRLKKLAGINGYKRSQGDMPLPEGAQIKLL